MGGIDSPLRECAVCIPDGARLTLEGISEKLQEDYRLSSVEKVTFRQLSASTLIHRDAVEFGNGMKVRLQELEEGQRLEVRALASKQVGDSERQFIRRNA